MYECTCVTQRGQGTVEAGTSTSTSSSVLVSGVILVPSLFPSLGTVTAMFLQLCNGPVLPFAHLQVPSGPCPVRSPWLWPPQFWNLTPSSQSPGRHLRVLSHQCWGTAQLCDGPRALDLLWPLNHHSSSLSASGRGRVQG